MPFDYEKLIGAELDPVAAGLIQNAAEQDSKQQDREYRLRLYSYGRDVLCVALVLLFLWGVAQTFGAANADKTTELIRLVVAALGGAGAGRLTAGKGKKGT